ncbi:hypothetical protein, partial [Hymenobacter coccineus]|uniref:hypothetical protein n=1 Tax=Hymenobacter coccineus TaxID=1908235 RepID=UPI000A8BCDBF
YGYGAPGYYARPYYRPRPTSSWCPTAAGPTAAAYGGYSRPGYGYGAPGYYARPYYRPRPTSSWCPTAAGPTAAA